MTRLLVTGFGHFPGAPINPTGDILTAVKAMTFPPHLQVKTHLFRTVYAEVQRDLPRLIAEQKPDALILFGLANKAKTIRIETTARNSTHRTIPDADGNIFPTRSIDPAQPSLRKTGLDGPMIARHLRKAGLKTSTSRNAGNYLCNFSYFHALQAVEQGLLRQALFVHVPLPPEPLSAADLARAAHEIMLVVASADKTG